MSDLAADKSAGTVPESSQNNNWNTVQNLLGFLLAGFGAVLSFIGVRSTEVTTVLRNDPGPASLIALFLLLGVLSAVLIVATDTLGTRNVSLASAVGIILVLFAVGASVVLAIPGGETPRLLSLVIGIALVVAGIAFLVVGKIAGNYKKPGAGAAAGSNKKSESTSQDSLTRRRPIGIALVVAGIAFLVVGKIAGTDQKPGVSAAAETAKKSESTSQDSDAQRLPDPPTAVPLSVIFILASVIFIAISAYGAMRLETNSQRSFDAQVVAGVSMNASGETVSAHVTASRIKNSNYIGITVKGLPRIITVSGLPHIKTLAAVCQKVEENAAGAAAAAKAAAKAATGEAKVKAEAGAGAAAEASKDSITCMDFPCNWLPRNSCPIVMAATIAPNDNGDVDETLNTPLSVGQFQDIHVQAVICSHAVNSCFPLNASGSQVDVFVPTPETPGSR